MYWINEFSPKGTNVRRFTPMPPYSARHILKGINYQIFFISCFRLVVVCVSQVAVDFAPCDQWIFLFKQMVASFQHQYIKWWNTFVCYDPHWNVWWALRAKTRFFIRSQWMNGKNNIWNSFGIWMKFNVISLLFTSEPLKRYLQKSMKRIVSIQNLQRNQPTKFTEFRSMVCRV